MLGSMTKVVDMTISGAAAPVTALAGVPAWMAAVLTPTAPGSFAGCVSFRERDFFT